jgi:16S rRNA (guanine966-N2)-methyltransferase
MSRIISGLAGSLRLSAAAKETRPTSDRVKESLFSTLENQGAVKAAKVLDLFAGSGALGLEALSRGASSLVMVEKSKSAFAVCKKNSDLVTNALAKQGIEVSVELRNTDSTRYLKTAEPEFDLVFVDPPYEFSETKLQEILALLVGKLSASGVLVLERSAKSPQVEVAGLERYLDKTYGDTQVSLFRRFSQ